MNVEPWWRKANPRRSGSLPMLCFVAHLFIYEDPDRNYIPLCTALKQRRNVMVMLWIVFEIWKNNESVAGNDPEALELTFHHHYYTLDSLMHVV